MDKNIEKKANSGKAVGYGVTDVHLRLKYTVSIISREPRGSTELNYFFWVSSLHFLSSLIIN